MFITPISVFSNHYNAKQVSNNYQQRFLSNTINADTVSFSGSDNKKSHSKYSREQLYVLLSSKMSEEKLSVRMPESELEKEVILDILEQRKRLDRYFELCEKVARIRCELNEIKSLQAQDPNHPDLPGRISAFEEQYGSDGEEAIVDLEREIEDEGKKEKGALEFFEQIDELEEELIDNRSLKNNDYKKFWDQMPKKNINKDGKYSTQDLIDIISGKKVIEQPVKKEHLPNPAHMTQKQLEKFLISQIENSMRRVFNLYRFNMPPDKTQQMLIDDSKKYEAYFKALKATPKQIESLRSRAQNNYDAHYISLPKIEVEPMEVMLDKMADGTKELKGYLEQIKSLKEQLVSAPDNVELTEQLKQVEAKLEETKGIWLEWLDLFAKTEAHNRSLYEQAGGLAHYDYFTSENWELSLYKDLNKHISRSADGKTWVLPESEWEKLFAAWKDN